MHQEHTQKVDRVAKEVRAYFANRTPFKIFHGSTNSTRTLTFKRSEMIDVSDFTEILSIDTKNQTAIVEANVPMDKLVARTLKSRLVPPVIPEFPGITVGGAIQGGAGESSSYKWGFFSQNINWIEMILANGDILRCSPSEHADLFDGTAGASGTLGIITAAEVHLLPAQKFVNLTYLPVTSFADATKQLYGLRESSYDFIDSIMYGPDHGLIVLGTMSDKSIGKRIRFARAIDDWYYLHLAHIDEARKTAFESVPLVDYLFRYDRGAFWVGRYAFARFGIPFNRLSRFILNPLLHTRELYKALQDSGTSQEYLIQDLTVPFHNAVPFLQYIDQKTHIYPLWICPIKPAPRSPFLCNSLATDLAINIGIWGPRIPTYEAFINLNRDLERELTTMNGKKWMYAHSYYTKDEFWKLYDKQWYEELRLKYHAITLPDIYEKTSRNKRVPISGRRGLLNTMLGKSGIKISD